MIGYKLFLERLEKLGVSDRRKILESVFCLRVLVYNFYEGNEMIVFKIYDGYRYYQFNFIFSVNSSDLLKIKIEDRIVVCDFFVESLILKMKYVVAKENKFYQFLKILSDCDLNYIDSFFKGWLLNSFSIRDCSSGSEYIEVMRNSRSSNLEKFFL